MQKSASPTSSNSIPAPVRPSSLLLVGKKGPAFSNRCADCNGFDTVVIRRNGKSTTVRCVCQLAVTA